MIFSGILSRHRLLILGLIFLLAISLRFYQINSFDLASDNSLYSVRALTWSDFLGDNQTTPIQWFGELPIWSYLSFHDAPPLVFAVQYFFFSLLGDSSFAARLPFVLAGLVLILVSFYYVRRLRGEGSAFLVAILMSISSYAVWASLSGYLEAIQYLFIATAFFCLVSWFETKGHPSKWFYLWVSSLALAILSKYTALLLLPAGALSLWWQWPQIKHQLSVNLIIKSGIIFSLILSPIIIYNVGIFLSQGHFDIALSSILGISSSDFGQVAERSASFNWQDNLFALVSTLTDFNSPGLVVLFILSFIFFAYRLFKKQISPYEQVLFINLIVFLVGLSLVGGGDRFMISVIPLALLFIVEALTNFYELIKHHLQWQKVFFAIITIILAGELLFSFNTNVSLVTYSSFYRSPSSFTDLGFNRLEKWLRQEAFTDLPAPQPLRAKSDFSFDYKQVKDRPLVIFDDSINWFPAWWHLGKYLVYYRLPVLPLTKFISRENISTKTFRQAGTGEVYFIYPVQPELLDPLKIGPNSPHQAAEKIVKLAGGKPVEVIYDGLGQEAFNIYLLSFDIGAR